MRNRVITLTCLLIVGLFIGVSFFMTHTQGQDTRESGKSATTRKDGETIKRDVLENGDPVVDLGSASTLGHGVEATSTRRLRNALFDIKDKNVPSDQISNFEISENSSEIQFGGPLSNLRSQPAFPVIKSSHVVIGEIKQATAFLSNHRNIVYSEFNLEITEVLGQKNDKRILPEHEISLVRLGGKVRFESGKILNIGIEGNPLPKVGKRYLMFLGYEKDADVFSIKVAYQIENGEIVPFDGRRLSGEYISQYRSLQQYNGMKEAEFVAAVRAVAGGDSRSVAGDGKLCCLN